MTTETEAAIEFTRKHLERSSPWRNAGVESRDPNTARDFDDRSP